MPGQLLLKLADGSVVPVSGRQGPPGPAGASGGSYNPIAVRADGAKGPQLPGVMLQTLGTGALVSGRLYYMPIIPQIALTLNELWIYVQTAATCTIRVGIYDANNSLQPVGAPLTSQDFSITTITGLMKATGLSIPLTTGPKLLALLANGAPTLAWWRGFWVGGAMDAALTQTTGFLNEMSKTMAFGALPTNVPWDFTLRGNTPFTYYVLPVVS